MGRLIKETVAMAAGAAAHFVEISMAICTDFMRLSRMW